MENLTQLYTMGYSCHDLISFVAVCKRYKINAVADVRSQPYSKFKPEFNREEFAKHLKIEDLQYVFLGNELGARIEAPECYINGKVDFSLVAKNTLFQEGLSRIKQGLKKLNIVLMCAEKDPITCHRTILICKNLKSPDIRILHILCNGALEQNEQAEMRLMQFCKLAEPDMFFDKDVRLEMAYKVQGQKIAYVDNGVDNSDWLMQGDKDDGSTIYNRFH